MKKQFFVKQTNIPRLFTAFSIFFKMLFCYKKVAIIYYKKSDTNVDVLNISPQKFYSIINSLQKFLFLKIYDQENLIDTSDIILNLEVVEPIILN